MTNIESKIAQIGALQEKVTVADRNLTFLKQNYRSAKERVKEHGKIIQLWQFDKKKTNLI